MGSVSEVGGYGSSKVVQPRKPTDVGLKVLSVPVLGMSTDIVEVSSKNV